MLRCEVCGRAYPIVGGIPRMLPDSAEEFADFMEGFGVPRMTCRESELRMRLFRELHGATRDVFTFEWLRYPGPGYEQNCSLFERVTRFDRQTIAGKTILDAGCGMGRFMEVAAGLGAHVVGIDLSRSVDRAYRETRFKPQIDLIQGDLLNPPLRSECFDAIYSIGALNHTPNTQMGFQAISRLLHPEGRISISVDHPFEPEFRVSWTARKSARVSRWASSGTRFFTTRMPHPLLHHLSMAAVPLGWLKHVADTNRLLKLLLAPVLLLPISAHENRNERLRETFEWLAPKHQWRHTTNEVMSWFEEEGFEVIHPLDQPASVMGIRSSANETQSQDMIAERSQHAYAGR
ncbi:MAG TPA: methyltransferase domain-containing protein [Terriglobia bacterium]|nr:methyltransferase domain-containing protein [Terriglobia bacterium]